MEQINKIEFIFYNYKKHDMHMDETIIVSSITGMTLSLIKNSKK